MDEPTTVDTVDAADEAFAAFMAIAGPDVLNRMNVDFEDSMLLVGRTMLHKPSATEVVATNVDRRGVDLRVRDDDGEHRQRLDFERPIEEPMELTEALYGLVARARADSCEPGSTTAEREFAEMTAIRTFLTTVETVADVHSHLRRITFAGGDLATFTTRGPDTFVYLLAPPPGCDELVIDQSFTWEQHGTLPDDVRPIGAYYTVRHWDPAARRLEILAVVHGDEGPASRWVVAAEPGLRVALWGPRAGYHPPAGTDHLLLVADDTGLPAVAAILEQLPEGVTAQVVAEVDCTAERQQLPSTPGVDVRWMYRDGAAPGTTTLLVDAVRRLEQPTPTTYVWGGGESRAMTAVRRYVRREVGLPRASVELVAYWRHSGPRGAG